MRFGVSTLGGGGGGGGGAATGVELTIPPITPPNCPPGWPPGTPPTTPAPPTDGGGRSSSLIWAISLGISLGAVKWPSSNSRTILTTLIGAAAGGGGGGGGGGGAVRKPNMLVLGSASTVSNGIRIKVIKIAA